LGAKFGPRTVRTAVTQLLWQGSSI